MWMVIVMMLVQGEFQTSNDQNPWVFPSLKTVSAGEMRLDPPSPVESQSREARVAWGTT